MTTLLTMPVLDKEKAGNNISFLRLSDYDAIVSFHRAARVATDLPLMPDYTLAAVAGRYYENLWMKHFQETARSTRTEAIKIENNGQIVGFVRYGLIFRPSSDAFDAYPSCQWGELHQIYVDPLCQRQGFGAVLLATAERRLAAKGAQMMLINALQGSRACAFYTRMGADIVENVTEQNERDGRLFEVPCHLFAKPLPKRGDTRVLPLAQDFHLLRAPV